VVGAEYVRVALERPQDFGQGVNARLPHEAKKILKNFTTKWSIREYI